MTVGRTEDDLCPWAQQRAASYRESTGAKFPRVPPVSDGGKKDIMVTIKQAASTFLAIKRIAVTGVSRNAQGHGGNTVYKRLGDRGYQVFAVNPNATEVEGDQCYPNLTAIPGGVDAVVIGTKPDATEATMRECAELGITHAWMHRAFGEGSVCRDATFYGREHGVTVIDGGCPLMFEPTADVAHKLMRFVLTRTGKVPNAV